MGVDDWLDMLDHWNEDDYDGFCGSTEKYYPKKPKITWEDMQKAKKRRLMQEKLWGDVAEMTLGQVIVWMELKANSWEWDALEVFPTPAGWFARIIYNSRYDDPHVRMGSPVKFTADEAVRTLAVMWKMWKMETEAEEGEDDE